MVIISILCRTRVKTSSISLWLWRKKTWEAIFLLLKSYILDLKMMKVRMIKKTHKNQMMKQKIMKIRILNSSEMWMKVIMIKRNKVKKSRSFPLKKASVRRNHQGNLPLKSKKKFKNLQEVGEGSLLLRNQLVRVPQEDRKLNLKNQRRKRI